MRFEKEQHQTELWSSRAGFIFASVGPAVGLGNVWRFPFLAYDYGGGAFFIPYFLASFVLGIPILILEISLGQYYRTGIIGSFGGIHERLRGVAASSIFCECIVLLYYMPLIAWTVHAFFETFQDFDTHYRGDADPYTYFLNDIVGMSTLETTTSRPSRVVWANLGYLVCIYILSFFCVVFGIKNFGRVYYFTTTFPVLLIFIFLIRTTTLEGAGTGVKEYIGIWDVSELHTRGEVWSTAVSQVFFSIGVTFGYFPAFGSSCETNSPVVANSIIIALSNLIFALISGFVVFSSLGHLAYKTGKPVADVAFGGPSLVFGSYPVALADLPMGQHWVRLFLIFMFLLGMNFGLALFENLLLVMHDSYLGKRFSKKQLMTAFMILELVISLLFVTDAGFIFLDVVDYYINFLLILVGFLEVFGAGWIFGIEEQIHKLGATPVALYILTSFGPFLLASIFWYSLEDNAILGGCVTLIASWLVGNVGVLLLCIKVAHERNRKLKEVIYTLTMENVILLKDRLSTHINPLPLIWAFMIKHVLPFILLMCFINLCASKTADRGESSSSSSSVFGNYGGYVMVPYQMIGMAFVVLALVIFLGGVVTPRFYHKLIRKEISNAVDELNRTQDSRLKASKRATELLPDMKATDHEYIP